jgi:hypothetical protein
VANHRNVSGPIYHRLLGATFVRQVVLNTPPAERNGCIRHAVANWARNISSGSIADARIHYVAASGFGQLRHS